MKERITGVAILDEQGRLWSLPQPLRHGHIPALGAFLNTSVFCEPEDQGFTTNTGRFVRRKEALKIATAAGQIIRKTGPADILFSEDMW